MTWFETETIVTEMVKVFSYEYDSTRKKETAMRIKMALILDEEKYCKLSRLIYEVRQHHDDWIHSNRANVKRISDGIYHTERFIVLELQYKYIADYGPGPETTLFGFGDRPSYRDSLKSTFDLYCYDEMLKAKSVEEIQAILAITSYNDSMTKDLGAQKLQTLIFSQPLATTTTTLIEVPTKPNNLSTQRVIDVFPSLQDDSTRYSIIKSWLGQKVTTDDLYYFCYRFCGIWCNSNNQEYNKCFHLLANTVFSRLMTNKQ